MQATFNGRRVVIFSGGPTVSDEQVFDEVRAIRDGGGLRLDHRPQLLPAEEAGRAEVPRHRHGDLRRNTQVIVLAGDVGGTKTNLALYDKRGSGLIPVRETSLQSRQFDSLEAAIAALSRGGPAPGHRRRLPRRGRARGRRPLRGHQPAVGHRRADPVARHPRRQGAPAQRPRGGRPRGAGAAGQRDAHAAGRSAPRAATWRSLPPAPAWARR